ncbi:hypothetical protein BESB_060800 [Besnoitia besnoiti]|uniref:Protein kinase domain-containing protein n=1 Tax=Besnoitia besnoiti TaxID=94643 RepID=A0A2A9MHS3_BESBE|nr:hypothetical protein BESB_060800 [Besnoitia besnoiti]PFH35193.1 hypothetical protein BESB_060800 [Besnoitia besnoiti]
MEAGPEGCGRGRGRAGVARVRTPASSEGVDKVGGQTESPVCGRCDDDALNDICLEYSYEELYVATAGFSVVVGQGAYGSVYEGVLRDGGSVAVKWLHKPTEAGFEKEVQVLSKFRHPNLVILMGFARHGTDRFLVYELLPGGDVGARLQKGPLLSWQDRLCLALDSASALSHLQHHSPQVFHRDIKTANILLDKHNNAKVADFGLACLAKKGADACPVKQTAGTVGYADPKYISSAVVTEKTEVYSFGMVLLELLTARPPAVLNADGSITYLLTTIGTSIWRTLRYVDSRAKFPPHIAHSIAVLAFSCIQDDEQFRPSFYNIVQQLRLLCTSVNLLPTPSPALGRAVAQAAAAAAAVGATKASSLPAPRAQLQGASHREPPGAADKKSIAAGREAHKRSKGSRREDHKPLRDKRIAGVTVNVKETDTLFSGLDASVALAETSAHLPIGEDKRRTSTAAHRTVDQEDVEADFPCANGLKPLDQRASATLERRRSESRQYAGVTADALPSWQLENHQAARCRDRAIERQRCDSAAQEGPGTGEERTREQAARDSDTRQIRSVAPCTTPETTDACRPANALLGFVRARVPLTNREEKTCSERPSLASSSGDRPQACVSHVSKDDHSSRASQTAVARFPSALDGDRDKRRGVPVLPADSRRDHAALACTTWREATSTESARRGKSHDKAPRAKAIPRLRQALPSSPYPETAGAKPLAVAQSCCSRSSTCGVPAQPSCRIASTSCISPTQAPAANQCSASRYPAVPSSCLAVGAADLSSHGRSCSHPMQNVPRLVCDEGAAQAQCGSAPARRQNLGNNHLSFRGGGAGSRDVAKEPRGATQRAAVAPPSKATAPSFASFQVLAARPAAAGREPFRLEQYGCRMDAYSRYRICDSPESPAGSYSSGCALTSSPFPFEGTGAACQGLSFDRDRHWRLSAPHRRRASFPCDRLEVRDRGGDRSPYQQFQRQHASLPSPYGWLGGGQGACRGSLEALASPAACREIQTFSGDCFRRKEASDGRACAPRSVQPEAAEGTEREYAEARQTPGLVACALQSTQRMRSKHLRYSVSKEHRIMQQSEARTSHHLQGLHNSAGLYEDVNGVFRAVWSSSILRPKRQASDATSEKPQAPPDSTDNVKKFFGCSDGVAEASADVSSSTCSDHNRSGSPQGGPVSPGCSVPDGCALIRQTGSLGLVSVKLDKRSVSGGSVADGSTSTTAPATAPPTERSACSTTARGVTAESRTGSLRPAPAAACPSEVATRDQAVRPLLHQETLQWLERPFSAPLESAEFMSPALSGAPSVELLKRHSEFLGDASCGRPASLAAVASSDRIQKSFSAAESPDEAPAARSSRGSGAAPSGPRTLRLSHSLGGAACSLPPPDRDGSSSAKNGLLCEGAPSQESVSEPETPPLPTAGECLAPEGVKVSKADLPCGVDVPPEDTLSPAPCDPGQPAGAAELTVATGAICEQEKSLKTPWRPFAGWTDWGKLWACQSSATATTTEDADPAELGASTENSTQLFGEARVDGSRELSADVSEPAGSTESDEGGVEQDIGDNATKDNDRPDGDADCTTQVTSAAWEEEPDAAETQPRITRGETDEAAESLPPSPNMKTEELLPAARGQDGLRDFFASLFSARLHPPATASSGQQPRPASQASISLSPELRELTSDSLSSCSSPSSAAGPSRRAQLTRTSTSSCTSPATPCNETSHLQSPSSARAVRSSFLLDELPALAEEGRTDSVDETHARECGDPSRDESQDTQEDRHHTSGDPFFEKAEATESTAEDEGEGFCEPGSKKDLPRNAFRSKTFLRALSGPKTIRHIQGRDVPPFETSALGSDPAIQEMRAERARRFLAGGGL